MPELLLGGQGPPLYMEMSIKSLSKMVRLGGALTDSRLSSICCSGSRSCRVHGPWYGGGSSPSEREMVGGRSISCCMYGYVGWKRLKRSRCIKDGAVNLSLDLGAYIISEAPWRETELSEGHKHPSVCKVSSCLLLWLCRLIKERVESL